MGPPTKDNIKSQRRKPLSRLQTDRKPLSIKPFSKASPTVIVQALGPLNVAHLRRAARLSEASHKRHLRQALALFAAADVPRVQEGHLRVGQLIELADKLRRDKKEHKIARRDERQIRPQRKTKNEKLSDQNKFTLLGQSVLGPLSTYIAQNDGRALPLPQRQNVGRALFEEDAARGRIRACAHDDYLAGRTTLVVRLDFELVAAEAKGRLWVDNAQHAGPYVVHCRAGEVGAFKGRRDAAAAGGRPQRAEEEEGE